MARAPGILSSSSFSKRCLSESSCRRSSLEVFSRAVFPAAVWAILRETMHVWTLTISTRRDSDDVSWQPTQLSKLTPRHWKNDWRGALQVEKKACRSRFDPLEPPCYP